MSRADEHRRFRVAAVLALLALIVPAAAQESGRKIIATPAAPNAIGPYSQAVRVGNTVYVSGEIAIDPKTNQVLATANIEDQTRMALEKIRAILAATGLSWKTLSRPACSSRTSMSSTA